MHVKCLTFEDQTPSDDGDKYSSSRSSAGPKRVISVIISPKLIADRLVSTSGSTTKSDGEILLYNTAALSEGGSITGGVGSAAIRIPIHYGGNFGGAVVSVISDVDGYVLFNDGITIDSKKRTGGNSLPSSAYASPLYNCKVDIIYV